jgi:hypothetical protein
VKNSFNETDRKILIIAALVLLVFSLLLYDDSFLLKWTHPHQKVIANIISVDNDVRQKFSSEFSWQTAQSRHPIYFGDSIFTGDNSHVWVELLDGSQFSINENSLVVFNMTAEQLQFALKTGTLNEQLKGFVSLDSKPKKPVSSSRPNLALEPPQITYPEKDSTIFVKIDHHGQPISTNAIRISWRQKKISRYELQISNDQDFKNLLAKQQVTAKSVNSPALSPGKYFVRVKEATAQNAWSSTVQFQIKYSLPAQLKAPQLELPHMVYRVPNKNPLRINWKAVDGAAQYEVAISNTPEFIQKTAFTATQATLTLHQFDAGRFYYRVTPMSTVNGSGESAIGQLTIISDRPVLDPVPLRETKARDENDLGDPVDIPVSWSSNPVAKKYLIELSDTDDFKSAKKYESESPSTVVNVPKIGSYFWRVRPFDRKGKPLSDFSDNGIVHYKFKDGPLPPHLVEPLNEMTLFFQSANITPFWLEWRPSKQAANYILEVSSDKEFSNVVISQNLKTPRWLIKKKIPDGTLFWRVKTISSDNKESTWSETRTFQLFSGRAPATE